MNGDDSGLSFGTSIDMSGFEEGAARIEAKVSEIGERAEVESSRISELLNNVPNVNINIISNASESLAVIQQGFDEIDRVVDTNAVAIRELEAEYERLKVEMGKAYKSGNDKEYNRLKKITDELKQNIAIRHKVNSEAVKTADQLAEVERKLQKEAEAAAKAQSKHASFRTELMNAKNTMRQLINTGQQNTAQYEETRQKVVELTQAMQAANKQTKALASPTAQLQGMISGLSGVAGAASVAQGAIGLFGGENEKLQKIMLRVQSLMSITIGLQQIQQTLNKNSAFSLVTLTSLKKLWAKLIGDSNEELLEESVAIAENTAENEKNAVATTADTAAQNINNTSTAAGTTAQAANAVATRTATAATVAGTVATRAASIALKGLKVALISTGIGAIVVLVGELVAWLTSLFATISETEKREEGLNKVMDEGSQAYAKARGEIEGYITKIDKFNGTKKQEKELVKELNSKYGEALGYYNSIAQWKEVLKTKGEAYCNMLLKEAEAQAILSEYTEAYIALVEAKNKKESEYGSWYTTKAGDEARKKEAVEDAQETADYWMEEYRKKMSEAQSVKIESNIGGHEDPTKGSSSKKKGSDFDPDKAAMETQKAVDAWKEKVKKYIADANSEVNQLVLDSQEEGLVKELNTSRMATQRRIDEWENQFNQLAEQRKEYMRSVYMQQKGATEVGWYNSADGKKSIEEYKLDLLQNEDVAKEYYRVRQQITENGEREISSITQKYNDTLIEQYGTQLQKTELLHRKWMEKLKFIPTEYLDEAGKQMDSEFSKLSSENFKELINWDSVFGSLDKQSMQSLQINLERVKKYFDENKGAMDAKEIKEYTDAIKQMEDEIASRNPFAALHKSIKDIAISKDELITAFQELVIAQNELNAANDAYKLSMQELNEVNEKIESGELAQGCEEQAVAADNLRQATERLATAQKNNAKAENNIINTRNNLTSSYRSFSTNLKNSGSTVKDVGNKAKNLAKVFSNDLADGIGKGLDFMDEIFDAASSVIDAVSDVGKSAAKGIESTVDAAAQGATASAAAGATAISTIEKASVILAVISAALQVATAIANLFSDDESKQKEIEHLQERIDQLQWELDNQDAVKLQEKTGDAVKKVRDIYKETLQACKDLYSEELKNAQWFQRYAINKTIQSEAYRQSVEKIADAYADVDYTANKALGEDKYKSTRKELKNIAEQQILLQKQIDAENSKKKTDSSKIADWKREMQENANKMAEIINGMMEDIIGSTAEDLASELGDAFFEAAQAGEDAMEAWHEKVNDIVTDILKRMLITQLLEPEIGKIFDKYKKIWFDSKGNFQGIDKVKDSANSFADDLNDAGELFSSMYETLNQGLKDFFESDAEREGTSKGIATASQESVDENNARLTTIQGHTYSLVQGVNELNATSNQILVRVTGIERNTDETNTKLDNLNNRIRRIENDVNDMQTRGIKIQV